MEQAVLDKIAVEVEAQNPANEAERARLWMESTVSYLETAQGNLEPVYRIMEYIKTPTGYPAGKAWALFISGWVQLKAGNNDEASTILRKALDLFENFDDTKGIARCLNGLGVIELYLSLFDGAIETFKHSKAIASSIQWDEMIAVTDSNLGLVYLKLADYEEAANRLESAKKTGMLQAVNIVVTDCNLASAYLELRRFDEAEKLLADSLLACRKNGYAITEIDVLGKYGTLMERLGQKEKAAEMYEAAIAGAKISGNHRLLAENALELGKLVNASGDHDKSEAILLEADHGAHEGSLPGLRAKILAAIAQTRADKAHWQEAYEASRESALIESHVFTEKVAGQASGARAERIASETAAYRAQLRRLSQIAEIGREIAGAMDEESVGRILHEHIAKLMPINAFNLALFRKETQTLEYRYFIANDKRIEPFTVSVETQDCLAAYCVRTGDDIIIGDMERDLQKYVPSVRSLRKEGDDEKMRSVLYCPVRMQNRIIAVVSVQNKRAAVYEEHHLEILHAVCAYVGVALENARLFGEIKLIAGTDPLTGILNRRRFMEIFLQETERVNRYTGELGFIIFDLDHFKLVNDTHGHAAGDAVLKSATKLAAKGLRSTDYLARYGGEEFVLLLPNTGINGAGIVAERIRATFERETVRWEERIDIKFTASFGVADYGKGDDFDSLSARADKALYYSKETGRNKVAVEKAGLRRPGGQSAEQVTGKHEE